MKTWLAYLCLGLSMTLVGSYVALSKPLVAAFPDASGMVEIRNGNGVDGQLVEARAKRTTLIQPTARPAVSRIIPG